MRQKSGKSSHRNSDHEPKNVEKHRKVLLGANCSRVGFVDHIGSEGRARSFVTLGADESIPPPWMHRRIVVIDAGNGFVAVALAACNFGPHRVQAPSLLGMAFDAGAPFIKLEPPMRVGQVCSATDPFGCRGQGDQLAWGNLPYPERQMGARLVFVLFIVPGARLPPAIAVDVRGDLFLGPSRSGKNNHKRDESCEYPDRVSRRRLKK